jgi:hypothetical protein
MNFAKMDPVEKCILHDCMMLLLKDPESLSDGQLANLLANKDMIKNTLHDLFTSFPHRIEEIQRYRVRKKELLALPREKLVEMWKDICARRSAAMAADPDDTKLPDSFFEMAPIDSDRHIIHEILEERKAVQV